MTVQLSDLMEGFWELGLGRTPVVVHASLSSMGHVEGGAQAVVDALLASFPTVVVPTFTYKTMVVPLTGPQDNGISYGSHTDQNRMAEFFTPDMPVDPMMGIIPETLRRHRKARRTRHPIQSFAGVNAQDLLQTQTMQEPQAPLGALEQQGGWVVLLGVNHTVNTSIHYAERLAGRRQFTRWALTPAGICECPNFPGCSAGFEAIAPDLRPVVRQTSIGQAIVQAVPVRELFKAVLIRLKDDPLALLCPQEDCARCNQLRMLL